MPAHDVASFEAERTPNVLKLVDGLAKMILRYRKYRQRLAEVATLRSMSDRELKDIGVYRCDIDRIARR